MNKVLSFYKNGSPTSRRESHLSGLDQTSCMKYKIFFTEFSGVYFLPAIHGDFEVVVAVGGDGVVFIIHLLRGVAAIIV